MAWKCRKCGHEYFEEKTIIREDIEVNKSGLIIARDNFETSVTRMMCCRACGNKFYTIERIAEWVE